MVPGVAKLGNICFGRRICVREAKMFLTPGKNIFCFRAAKFVSATRVSRAAKLGNLFIRNDVSATTFPSLARPLLFYPFHVDCFLALSDTFFFLGLISTGLVG